MPSPGSPERPPLRDATARPKPKDGTLCLRNGGVNLSTSVPEIRGLHPGSKPDCVVLFELSAQAKLAWRVGRI